MKKSGMILEGGGTRGVFTAGVLDYFMEQGMYLPYVIGVSAGACNAVNYVSRQPDEDLHHRLSGGRKLRGDEVSDQNPQSF